MPQYIIVYSGGEKPSTLEEGKQNYAKYMDWLKSLGDAVVSPANPFKNTHTISPEGTVTEGSSTAMSGFTVIEAASMETVLEMAKSCPFLEVGGTLEVSELVKMPAQN